MTCSSLSLIQKYDRPVPRYTSYPTAPHFSADVGEDAYRRWLGEIAPGTPLSLYVHVPFCASMCWFCGCHTKITQRYQPIATYVGHVLKEMLLLAEALPARMSVAHVHWGGGSPTMLHAEDWQRMAAALQTHFHVLDDAELAVELDPRTATKTYVHALADAGVTRVSIGVQDFDARVQEAINRIQPYDQTAQVVDWLRAAGIHAINMDLMYGLPYQSVETVIDQVDLAVSLNPQRIALFGYAHVPWMKTHQKQIDEAVLPDSAERADQFDAARARLLALGYCAIGLDHFARDDDELVTGAVKRNFQGYTVDDAPVLLGLGASSIGSLPQAYLQNEPATGRYQASVAAGHLPIAKGRELTGEDQMRREIINSLMCDLFAELGPQMARYGDALAELQPLMDDGLVVLEGSRLSVTEKGRPFVRVVASAFDTYLAQGLGRHSKAV
ncbi:MAG: oxygen-independent coproporphyrinogen III oxidase [Parvibaculum sp.]